MKITAYCGISVEENGPLGKASCSIVLYAEQGTEKKKRVMSYWLGSSDYELASIQLLRLLLSSIKPKYRNNLTIHINDNAIGKFLEQNDGNYRLGSAKYEKEVNSLRELYKLYKNVSIIINATNNQDMDDADCLARKTIVTQKNEDSGTVEVK